MVYSWGTIGSVAMQGLQGRPAKRPSIEGVRELSLEEVRAMPRANVQRVKSLRDSHHMAARLLAMGLDRRDVAERTGYSYNGLSLLCVDPSFQELLQHYREVVTEQFVSATDEYFSNLTSVRVKSLRQIGDRLDEADQTGEKLPLNQLLSIHADTADRSGYPKRKESVNLNLDFADRLEAAVRRSNSARVIEGEASSPALPRPIEQGEIAHASPSVGETSSRGVGSGVEENGSSVERLAPESPQPHTSLLDAVRDRLRRRA